MNNISKIRELESVLGAGARNNKYRVIFPYFGRELDIQTHDVTAPGRSIGTAEVFLKGRKYQLAGDRADEGTITLTFYNDPEMVIRRFFLQGIQGIQSYNVPLTIDGSTEQTGTDLLGRYIGTIGRGSLNVFDEIRNNFKSVINAFRHLADSPALTNTHTHKRGSGKFNDAPWYQSDIRVQQLNHNEEVTTEAIYHNAFVTEVSGIDYQDEVGEISTTTLTIAYTSVSYDEDTNNRIRR